MEVKISKTKENLFDVCIEKYKCGKICKDIKDIHNYIFHQICDKEEHIVDLFVEASIDDKEYKEIVNIYKGE